MKTIRLRPVVLAAVVGCLSLSTGCATFASFQSADTVGKGQLKYGVGATYTSYGTTLNGKATTVGIPAGDIWGRYGVTDKLEVHALVWIPMGATAGVKYQLLGSRDRAGPSLSLGLDLGYLQISSTSGSTTTSSNIFDTYVPVYLGYRLNPGFAFYLTPKYLLRLGFSNAGTGVDNEVGGTVGVALGKNTTFLVEGTVVDDLTTGLPSFTGGLGVAFR